MLEKARYVLPVDPQLVHSSSELHVIKCFPLSSLKIATGPLPHTRFVLGGKGTKQGKNLTLQLPERI